MRRGGLVWAVAALVLWWGMGRAGAAEEAAAPPRQIFFAHTQKQAPESDPAAAVAARFKAGVEERSGGRIRVHLFPEGEVGGNRETAALVARDVVTTALVTVGGVVPFYPLLAATQLPFAFDDEEQARQVYAGPFGQDLAGAIAAETPFQVLGFADPGGFLLLTNSRHALRRPEDLAGLKIRTIPGLEVLDATITALGARPVKVASREDVMALASGVVDGQLQTGAPILARHYDDVQKYVTEANFLYAPYVWLFNKAAFAAFPAEDRAMLAEVARQALDSGETLARNGHMMLQASLARRLEMQVLSGEERQAFRAAAQPAVRELMLRKFGEAGSDLLDRLARAAAEGQAEGR